MIYGGLLKKKHAINWLLYNVFSFHYWRSNFILTVLSCVIGPISKYFNMCWTMLHHDFLWETSCFHLAGMNTETPKQLSEPSNFGETWQINQLESPKRSKKNLGGFSQASAKFTVQFRLRQKTGNAERNPMGGLCFSNDPHKVNLRTLPKVFRHSGGIDGCYSDLPSGNQLWLKLENQKKT